MSRTPNDVNPQMAATDFRSSVTHVIEQSSTRHSPPLRIGILLDRTEGVHDQDLRSIQSPAARCQLTGMAVLEEVKEKEEGLARARKWWEKYGTGFPIADQLKYPGVYTEQPAFYLGESGYEAMLRDRNLDAIYIVVPTGVQSKYALAALRADKHVLVHDPESTSFAAYREQVQVALERQKFIQFSTMFQKYHLVTTFLDSVDQESYFGKAVTMHVKLSLDVSDFAKLNIPLPLQGPEDGCIRRLARFCVLIALLLLQNKRYKGNQFVRPTTVQITSSKYTTSSKQSKTQNLSENGDDEENKESPSGDGRIWTSAEGVVHFTDNRKVTFSVEYKEGSQTRQVLEVRSDRNQLAVMNDFVIPHADGLANFRLYDENKFSLRATDDAEDDKNFSIGVTSGESLDVWSGPPPDVMMWRTFRSLCRDVEMSSNGGSEILVGKSFDAETSPSTKPEWNPLTRDRKSYANIPALWTPKRDGLRAARSHGMSTVSLHLKTVLEALEESASLNGAEVPVTLDHILF